jgi:hypothetical protein
MLTGRFQAKRGVHSCFGGCSSELSSGVKVGMDAAFFDTPKIHHGGAEARRKAKEGGIIADQRARASTGERTRWYFYAAFTEATESAEQAGVLSGIARESSQAERSTNYQLLSTNYQLPTTKYQIPNTNYQIPSTNYQLPTTNYRFTSSSPVAARCGRGILRTAARRLRPGCSRGWSS